jgi:leucyl aminopeptidase (aminopeptidase T)
MATMEDVARRAIEVSLDVKSGETVWIHGWDHTIDLLSHLAWECRKRGCTVILTVQPEDFWLRSITQAPLELVNRLEAYQATLLRETDAYIFTLGPKKPIPWEKIPKERQSAVSVWLDERYDRSTFAKEWAAIAKARKVKMLAIEATLATEERAEALGLNYEEWRNVMLDGCVADYHEVARHGKILASLLSGKEKVHVTTPHGTDLRFDLDSRSADFLTGQSLKRRQRKDRSPFFLRKACKSVETNKAPKAGSPTMHPYVSKADQSSA